jgi:hypothetical protein
MASSFSDDRVVLDMASQDYGQMLALFAVTFKYLRWHERLDLLQPAVDLVNRLNAENPHYTPFVLESTVPIPSSP